MKQIPDSVYNIYLDESAIDNPRLFFEVVWWIWMRRNKRNEIVEKMKKLKENHRFWAELKRTKVSKRYTEFYKWLIDLFFEYSEDDLQFHCIVADKRKINLEWYHENDKELWYYKFIYQLLKQKLYDNNEYYVFLDFKQTKREEWLRILKNYLWRHILFNNTNTVLKRVDAIHSDQNLLIQFADFLIWAVQYCKNNLHNSEAKKEIVHYIAQKLWITSWCLLDFCSTKSEKKFNIFCILFS